MNFCKYGQIFWCLLLISCQVRENEPKILSIPLNEKIELRFSDFFDTLRIVPLETNENTLIGGIDKVLTTDAGIFVLDRRIAESLYLFDYDGKILRSFVGTGEGPGEFIRVSNFFWNPETRTVTIQDNSLPKVLEMTLDGEVIRDERLVGDAFFFDLLPIRNGYFALKPNGDDTGVNFELLDSKWSSQGQAFAVPVRHPAIVGNPKFQYFYPEMDGGVLIKEPLKNEIFRIEQSRELDEFVLEFESNSWIPSKVTLESQEAYREIWESGAFALGDQIQDMGQVLLMNFWEGNKIGMLSLNKSTGEARIVENWINDMDGIVKKIPGLMPSNEQPGQLIIDLPPAEISNLLHSSEGTNPYREIAKGIPADRESNPVLFIYSKKK